MRIFLSVLLLLAPLAAVAGSSAVDPASLFDGRTQGRGVLRFVFGHARPYHVDNVGHRERDGTFRLEQVVHFDGEPAHARNWRIGATAPGRYVFDMSDAIGPGVAVIDGTRLRLRFAPAHLVRMEQVLQRRTDGSIDNVGTIRLLGLPIGHIVETIVPAPSSGLR